MVPALSPTARLAALLVFGLACACGPAAREAPRAPGSARDSEARFDRLEDEVLRDLATIDRRMATRARITPTEDDLRRVAMAAVLSEDRTVAVVDGAIDPFSFDARARGLDGARQKLASLPQGRPSERELLTRLVEAELLRLEEERTLPRSASLLVRAIVDTWRPPKTEREAAEVDHWLARRLGELCTSMTAANPAVALDVVRARELDDALDALERLAATPGFTKTTQELVRVREALAATASRPAAGAHSDWPLVAARLKAHLGVTASPDALSQSLAALANDLRTKGEQAIVAAHLSQDALANALERQVFASGTCLDAVPGSPIRSLAAPPEREPACHLRHAVARAEDDSARAIALAAMHDHVVVAEWALDVARGASTIADAGGKHRLLLPVPPEVRARYERIAVARPVTAIGAGETARILMEGDPKARAAAWSTLGDVPLDVVRRELPPR